VNTWLAPDKSTYQALGRVRSSDPSPGNIGSDDRALLQLCVVGLGGDEDRDVGVGVFPQNEELLIRGARASHVALHRASAGET
jgi:hypothetical protein